MEPRIIFLDIDGVLNYAAQGDGTIHHDSRNMFAPYYSPTYENTKNLLEIYQTFPNTEIVITSTWGNHLSHFGIWECLLYNAVHHEAPMKVHFDTVTPQKINSSREKEICMWLENHPKIKHFVILDDITMNLLKDKAVHVNPDTGLTKEDAEKAIRILK